MKENSLFAIKALIFDLDDTIVDIRTRTLNKLIFASQQLNITDFNANEIINKVQGHNDYTYAEQVIKMLYPDVDTRKFWEYFRFYGISHKYIGICADDSSFQKAKKNYKLFLLTNAAEVSARKKIADIKLRESLFEDLFFKENSKCLKPSPMTIKKILSKYDLTPSSVMLIGDSLDDYLASQSSKINFAAVTSGLTPKEIFLKRGLESMNIYNNLAAFFSKNGL